MKLMSALWGVCTAMLLAAGAAKAVDFPEIEPNDTKATAQPVTLSAGDTISGTTTGSVTTAGLTSADNFLITTAPQPERGKYRWRLVLTSAPVGHTMTIRGLTQTAGVPNAGSDATVQTGAIASATLFPEYAAGTRVIQWYSNGGSDQIYVRVTGTASTTAPYTATLECLRIDTLPPSDGGPVQIGTFTTGNITIGRGTGSTTDTDWWLYDQNVEPVPTFGLDDPSANFVTRPLPPGRYYIAFTNFNFASNQPSNHPEETFRSGAMLDFPNVWANSSTSTFLTATGLPVRVTDEAGAVFDGNGGDGLKRTPFSIIYYCFTVQPALNPRCQILLSPTSVINDGTGDVTITVTVTPGDPPAGPHGVTMPQGIFTAAPVFVEGPPDTFVAVATVAEGTPTGASPLSATVFSIADPTLTSTCNASLNIVAPPPGACCLPDSETCIVTSRFECNNMGGTYNGHGTVCQDPSVSVDSFPIPIPDFSGTTPGTASTSITIASGETAGALTVCVGLTHTFTGDLIMTLSNGTDSAILSNRQGGGNDLAGTYCFADSAATAWPPAGNPIPPGTYRPNQPFSIFTGGSMDGTWTLTITDNAGADIGTITSFSIANSESPLNCSFCPACAADYNQDGGVDGADVEAFYNDWENAVGCADVNEDGGIDGGDVEAFFNRWEAGGCD
ncbi:MAG: proprotein convertase P-domain-containing protein [Phycisphaerae bacterium]|nr:proprotein convertase P-domain-containing protein [Phycisphaerae bacterium]